MRISRKRGKRRNVFTCHRKIAETCLVLSLALLEILTLLLETTSLHRGSIEAPSSFAAMVDECLP